MTQRDTGKVHFNEGLLSREEKGGESTLAVAASGLVLQALHHVSILQEHLNPGTLGVGSGTENEVRIVCF